MKTNKLLMDKIIFEMTAVTAIKVILRKFEYGQAGLQGRIVGYTSYKLLLQKPRTLPNILEPK